MSQLLCLVPGLWPPPPHPPRNPVPRVPGSQLPSGASVHPGATPAHPTRCCSVSGAPRPPPRRALYCRGRAPRARHAPGPLGCSSAPRRAARTPRRNAQLELAFPATALGPCGLTEQRRTALAPRRRRASELAPGRPGAPRFCGSRSFHLLGSFPSCFAIICPGACNNRYMVVLGFEM